MTAWRSFHFTGIAGRTVTNLSDHRSAGPVRSAARGVIFGSSSYVTCFSRAVNHAVTAGDEHTQLPVRLTEPWERGRQTPYRLDQLNMPVSSCSKEAPFLPRIFTYQLHRSCTRNTLLLRESSLLNQTQISLMSVFGQGLLYGQIAACFTCYFFLF